MHEPVESCVDCLVSEVEFLFCVKFAGIGFVRSGEHWKEHVNDFSGVQEKLLRLHGAGLFKERREK